MTGVLEMGLFAGPVKGHDFLPFKPCSQRFPLSGLVATGGQYPGIAEQPSVTDADAGLGGGGRAAGL